MLRSLTLHCAQAQPVAWPKELAEALQHTGQAVLHVAKLVDLRPHLNELKPMLDQSELERASRFRFEHDQERFILGHGMLRSVLGAALGISPDALRYERGPHGKPYLKGTNLRFSFSDTKDAILVCYTSGMEAGADLETMGREVDHAAVAHHYFTEAETEFITSGQGQTAKRVFLELWTRKEAVLKATGVGITDDLRSLCVLPGINAAPIQHGEMRRMASPRYYVSTWVLGESHIASLATTEPVLVTWAEFRL